MGIIGLIKETLLGKSKMVQALKSHGSESTIPNSLSIDVIQAENNVPTRTITAMSTKTGAQREIASVRNLLKEATALKKQKKYIEACDKLREAYSADGENQLSMSDRLRLPMYLQLAGRADDGWGELNRLNITYLDKGSQIGIAAYMAEFLRNESNYKNAVMFAVWELCLRKELDVETQSYIVRKADQRLDRNKELASLLLTAVPETMPATGVTPSGNPIYDVSYPAVVRRLKVDYDYEAVLVLLEFNLAKKVPKETIFALAIDLISFLANAPYDISLCREVLSKHLI